jgi:MoaA/NifB/PqqE/SkfB family radical SAM enzyme
MLYCDNCGGSKGWPTDTLVRTAGSCDICGNNTYCNVLPIDRLDPVKIDGIFAHTWCISLELSNICNMSHLHKRCPLSFHKYVGGSPNIILPTDVIKKIMDDLIWHGYKGMMCFSVYNEPLMDPRLLHLMHYLQDKSHGDIKAFLITNGTYLNQDIIVQLYDAGTSILWISGYSIEAIDRFNSYKVPDGMVVKIMDMREQVILHDTYTRDYIDSTVPCFAPLGQFIVRCTGDVVLCCRDFASHHTFGNVANQSIVDIISSKPVQDLYKELSAGRRTLDLCRRCNTSF